MKHSIPHDLSLDQARLVTRKALESYRQRFTEYSPEGEWVDEDTAKVRFKAGGRKLEGGVKVHRDKIDLELDVPMLFRPFRGIAIKVIEGEIRKWIEKARAGDL